MSRTLPCGEDVAPDVRAEGPAYAAWLESDRRERAAGLPQLRTDWHHWDADDYALEAPEEMPAGACWYVGPVLGIAQRTVRREQP